MISESATRSKRLVGTRAELMELCKALTGLNY